MFPSVTAASHLVHPLLAIHGLPERAPLDGAQRARRVPRPARQRRRLPAAPVRCVLLPAGRPNLRLGHPLSELLVLVLLAGPAEPLPCGGCDGGRAMMSYIGCAEARY